MSARRAGGEAQKGHKGNESGAASGGLSKADSGVRQAEEDQDADRDADHPDRQADEALRRSFPARECPSCRACVRSAGGPPWFPRSLSPSCLSPHSLFAPACHGGEAPQGQPFRPRHRPNCRPSSHPWSAGTRSGAAGRCRPSLGTARRVTDNWLTCWISWVLRPGLVAAVESDDVGVEIADPLDPQHARLVAGKAHGDLLRRHPAGFRSSGYTAPAGHAPIPPGFSALRPSSSVAFVISAVPMPMRRPASGNGKRGRAARGSSDGRPPRPAPARVLPAPISRRKRGRSTRRRPWVRQDDPAGGPAPISWFSIICDQPERQAGEGQLVAGQDQVIVAGMRLEARQLSSQSVSGSASGSVG